MDCQNWEPVTVRRSHTTSKAAPVHYSATASYMQKLDQSDGIVKKKELSSTSRTEIMQTRVALGLNQVQLNQQCAFPANTIRDIESGRAVPSPGQMTILSRVLKISLKYNTN